MSGVKLGGRESDLTIRECGLAINYVSLCPCELCVCLGRAAAGGAGASAGMWLAGWTQRRSHHSTAWPHGSRRCVCCSSSILV